jgi:fatty acid desaturase
MEPHGASQPWRFAPRSTPSALPAVDHHAFAAEIAALRARLVSEIGPADLVHLKKMERWGRMASVLGYACAWIAVNPLAPLLLGIGNMARWTMVTHHVMHRGYDKVPGVSARHHSRTFAQGWRRVIDWLDWMHPAAWAHEHNQLHHFHTGEFDDPDLVEHNGWLLRLRGLPRALKVLLIGVLMATWKFSYYAPNTWWAWTQHQRIRAHAGAEPPPPSMGRVWRLLFPGERVVLPLTARALSFHAHCVLPYALVRFGLIPALFLPLGTAAWAAVLINSLLAEIVANVHAFVIIVPNHAGDDVYRFDQRVADKSEFYLRQVIGSVNYPGGTDGKDFLMGYLNYQIEHHLWPDLPMLKYREAAPLVREICRRHGVPYVQDSVFRRFGKLWSIMVGTRDMLRVEAATRPPPVGVV